MYIYIYIQIDNGSKLGTPKNRWLILNLDLNLWSPDLSQYTYLDLYNRIEMAFMGFDWDLQCWAIYIYVYVYIYIHVYGQISICFYIFRY